MKNWIEMFLVIQLNAQTVGYVKETCE